MDSQKLRQAVDDFAFHSQPASSTNGSDPATVEDVRNLVKHLKTLLGQFVNELETD